MSDPLPTLVHMSDLHLGAARTEENLDRMIERILALPPPAGGFVAVITGDLVEDARRTGAFEAVVDRIERLERAGIPVVVVPGNHDYGYRLRIFERLVPVFERAFYRRFDRCGGVWAVRDGEVARVWEPRSMSYPRLELLGGVAFIGLDSQEHEFQGFVTTLASDGELGPRQRGRLEVMLASPRVRRAKARVLMMHHHPFHPFPLHRLRDARALQRVIRGRVDALLFGHNHLLLTGTDWRRFNGRLGIPRCYDAGSTTRSFGLRGYALVMDLNESPVTDRAISLDDQG